MCFYVNWLLLSFPVFAYNEISYAGMTIECPDYCGTIDDPHIESIYSLFDNTIHKLFYYKDILDDSAYGSLVNAWEGSEGIYTSYDWKASKGWQNNDFPRLNHKLGSYSDFRNAANFLQEDLHFYYKEVYYQKLAAYHSFLKTIRDQLKQKQYPLAVIRNKKIEFYDYNEDYPNESVETTDLLTDLKESISQIKRDISYYEQTQENAQKILEYAIDSIDSDFKAIFEYCLRNHQPEGIAFHQAIEYFLAGDLTSGIDHIESLISLSEKRQNNQQLLSKLYLLKGQLQSESIVYADAIISLTKALEKDPTLKEAYLERASAYFEIGDFDKAIDDFLSVNHQNDIPSSQWKISPKLGLGITKGILEGTAQATIEFVPEALTSVHGIAKGLWAFSSEPIQVSKSFIDATLQCIEYIKSNTMQKIARDMVPELNELINNFDSLGDFKKGKLIGNIIGKYGTDIFLCKYSVTAIKAYRDLKRANQLMTLEGITSVRNKELLIEQAKKHWATRNEFLKNSNSKIHESRQGKHIIGHKNYDPDMKKSIFSHSDPKELIKNHAGTGMKDSPVIPGQPGFKEIVNFHQFIGWDVNPITEIKTPTTWGKIHYSKDGVHIVPTLPRDKI
jgi:tetratricopeptide (TPR) repeat protein